MQALKTIKLRFNSKWMPEPYSGCWLWTASVDKYGYGRLSIEQYPELAHRVSWIIHNGDIPRDLCVLHRCDTPACVNPSHLWLGTKRDNNRDRTTKGRNGYYGSPGERNGLSKLTNAEVLAIRVDQRKRRVIAADYGISLRVVYSIKAREVWRHL